MTTCAPSSANRWTVARPMPEQPPVTTATLPSRRPDMSVLLLGVGEVVRACAQWAMKTFFSSVNAFGASGPSSRPSPDCLKPPKGVQ